MVYNACFVENESTEGEKTHEEGERDSRPAPVPMDAQDYDTRSEAGSSDGSLGNEEESGDSGRSTLFMMHIHVSSKLTYKSC